MEVQCWHLTENHWGGKKRMEEYLGAEGVEATGIDEREEVAEWKGFF